MKQQAPSMDRLFSVLKKSLAEARDVIRRVQRRPYKITMKGPGNPVTEADQAAEARIRTVVRRAFPDHGFLMEESGETLSSSPYRWIVDPLDGTINFAHGLPVASVSIGLEKAGRVVMGGVQHVFVDETFTAVRGRGARLNGRRLRASRTGRVEDSLLVTGFPYDRNEKADFYLSVVARFLGRCQGIRRLGSAALDLCYVAAGRFDGYWEFNLKPWDVAAGALIVEEAGGRVTDFQGRPYGMDRTAQTLATNGRLHAEMSAFLSSGT